MHHMHADHNSTVPEGISPEAFAVFQAFKTTMFLQRRLMTKVLANEETHPAQAGCLHVLAHRDGLSQTELADKLHVSRPTASTMLQKMEASGVIERRPDEQDQRLLRIYLTDAGRALVARLDAVFAQLVRAGVGSMADKDRDELHRLLNELNENLARAVEEDSDIDTTDPSKRR